MKLPASFVKNCLGRAEGWLVALLLVLTATVASFWTFTFRGDAEAPPPVMQSAMKTVKEASLPGKTEPFRFVAMGDWGAGSPMQFDVARQLAAALKKTPYQTVLLLGDNIYPDGNIKQHAEAYFNKPYKPLLGQGVSFYPVLGNHDVLRGYGSDQIRFFGMPGRYYQKSIGDIDFFMLDTNTFHQDPVQQAWLKKALAQSHADWKIVVGHHPLYTSGEHQTEGLLGKLRTTLEPIMNAGHADLYLAGHDHDYERFAPIGGVTHIVSGGGGAYLRNFEKVLPASVVRRKANHFVLFTLTGQHLQFQVIDKTGQIIDQGEIAPNAAKPAKKAA